jgi:(2R)-3-sulfolactate dehydrogenase (NADP+)
MNTSTGVARQTALGMDHKDRVMPLAAVERWIAAAFARHGARPAVARSVARALVAAEADGLKGHGLSRVPTYLTMLKAGKAKGEAKPVATRPKPAVLLIDAAQGFAYPAIDLAVKRLPAIVRRQGVALAAIRRSNHCGAAGHHVEALAKQGLVALLFANTPAAMAPAGGRSAVFGTNPIAFAAPLAGRAPVVVDMALSKVARGPIVAAKQKGEPIPEGWALDAEGNPTTDAGKALAGTMIPLGDAKGAALAFMVEVLAAALVGARFAFEASSFLDGKGGPPETGQLILAIDPAAIGGGHFAGRMAALAKAIEDQPGARLSGQRRLALRARAAAEGIVIPAALQAEIAALG